MNDALARYVPGRDGPFDFAEAAHLARRAGFSLPCDAVERLAAAGLDAALDQLFQDDEGDEARALASRAGVVTQQLTKVSDLPPLQACGSRGSWRRRPAGARAARAFWHGHFATSLDKVGACD